MSSGEPYPEQATNKVRSASKDFMRYVYILQCIDNSYYVGLTQNVECRFEEHLKKIGSIYTRHNRPVKVVYEEAFNDKVLAAEREKQLKRWSHGKKQALIEDNLNQLRKLSASHD